MEALLSPRLKNLIFLILSAILAAAILRVVIFPASELSSEEIKARVEKNCQRMEALLEGAVQGCLQRSDTLWKLYRAGRLGASGLEKREALVREENGIITDYIGEIFYFRPVALPEGGWRLINKGQDLYFLRRIGPQAYYIRFFMDIRSNTLQKASEFPYPVFDLRYAGQPLSGSRSDFSYDRALDRFYYTRVFKPSQNQLILSLVFSRATLAQRFRQKERNIAYGLVFLMLLVIFLACGRESRLHLALRLLALAGMAAAAWWGSAWFGARNIYFPGGPAALRSVFQLLALLVFFLAGAALSLRRARLKNNFLALAAFNVMALAAFFAADRILRHVDFPFGEFALNPDYLGLLALLVGLHAAPLLLAVPFMKAGPGRICRLIFSLQAALLILYSRVLPYPALGFFLLALAFAVLLLKSGRAGMRSVIPLFLMAISLMAISVSVWLGKYSLQEKKTFISENLKPIFSSQDHYAKLVAREIVYALNSRNAPLSAFFEDSEGDELADCWKETLAARENIASGIYVVAGDGSVLRSFSYQVPYIPLKKEDIFPFWHVENVEASLFGRRVKLAVATINVFQKEQHLGTIMVQVLNSADLILESGARNSLLSLDRKARNAGLGYIKLDESLRIMENPANLNVPDLASLMSARDAWVKFRSMGAAYRGYVFKVADETSMVFFPENTFFKSFSEYVKVLGFLLLLAALFNLRRLWGFQWRQIFGSFSVKVFAILVLLSMLTATVFSIFSLNFNFLSQENRRSQAVHTRGRFALNTINNLLAGGGEITQDHMFFLEKVLENDISVYEKGVLLFTSDYRKIIRSELPVYLNSGIRDLLQQDYRPFELRKNDGTLDLFFRTAGHYVFDIEFPYDSDFQLRARQYYVDFTVTLSFFLITLGMAAAFFFRNKILAPIHRLNRGMAEVQRGNLEPLAGIPSEIELRELYQGFNSMLEGIQEQKKSASEIAKMKTLVQLGRRVAHEVKNPLTPIRLSAEQIQRTLRDKGEGGRDVIASAVRYIIEETEHLRRVAFGFLNLSKLDELKAEAFRLDDLASESVSHLRPLYPRIRFSLDAGGGGVEVVADRRKIKQAIDNVLTNALEALEGRDGEIRVAVALSGESAEVRISDNGEGISSEELERIAREEFSTKDLGTGLGLVIARRFLELHQGGLEIESRPGMGTTVVMRFRQHAPQA